MKVLSIHAGADTGGVSWGMTGAFARAAASGTSDIEFRSAIKTTNYLDYNRDADWSEAVDLWNAADVVHLHNTYRTERIMARSGCKPKPLVLHHHGTHYRDNTASLNAWIRQRNRSGPGARAVVSTLDLLEQGPGLPWCPAAFDLDWLATHRKLVPGVPGVDRPLRIGHAPTNRAIKSTEAFLAAAEKLGETVPVEVVLIEGTTWAECLGIKGTVDVYFDQVILGYGCNAIEAWAMGIPVIAGAALDTLCAMDERFDVLPFDVSEGEGGIYGRLVDMASPTRRAHFGRVGLDHAHRWHDGTETVRVLSELYRDVCSD